jgi:YD repeat-containing protein
MGLVGLVQMPLIINKGYVTLKPPHYRCMHWLCNVLLALALTTPVLAQQSGPVQYVYDELGRLSKVIDAAGNVAEYVYDQVGNLLEIRRSTVTGLALFDFTPRQGPVGTQVTLQGRGFSTVPSENTVAFNGTTAAVLSATSASLVVTVPPGAATGPIAVTVAGNTATSNRNFTVPPGITAINPTIAATGSVIAPFQVQGSNLTGATFTFVSALVPPPVIVTSAAIDPTGTSATLNVTVNANATGSFVLVATNAAGSSSAVPAAANTLHILDGNADPDHDGLSNRDELAHGTDPFNPDTDGDGYSDGEEVQHGSNPLDARSIPVNPRMVFGVVVGNTFTIINSALPSANLPTIQAVGAIFTIDNGGLPTPNLPFTQVVGPLFTIDNAGNP